MKKERLFDVVAVLIKSPHTVRIFGRNKNEGNANAIINMAIMRRGVGVEFYSTATPGVYEEGDKWRGEKARKRKRKETPCDSKAS